LRRQQVALFDRGNAVAFVEWRWRCISTANPTNREQLRMPAIQPSLNTDDLVSRALALHRSGNLAGAQLLYSQILEEAPRDFDALHLLGVLRQQQGRNVEAHDLIDAACRINPASPEAHSNLGIVLQELGHNEEAVAAYDRALALRPRYAEALNNRGTALRALDRLAGAAMNFDRAIAIAPDYADAHYNRAGLLADLGRHEEAAASYGRAIALRGDHFESHRGCARALAMLGKFEAALASHERALALVPDDLDARLERGVVLSELARHQEALADYEAVLAKRPDSVAALNNRGAALQELDRDAEAEACFARALALAPDDPKVHANRGAVLVKTKRYEEALVFLDRAIALAPADKNALYNSGYALQALQRPREAVSSYDRCLALAPRHVEALNNRGAALNEIKMYDEALASFERALALAPGHAQARFNRGNAQKGLGRFGEASASFEAALATGADLPYALSGIAECAVKICDWPRTASIAAELASHVTDGKSIVSPFTLMTYDTTPALQLAGAKAFAAARFPACKPIHGGVGRHDRLRIAYLSANFNRHPMSHLMVNLFERHDRTKFEVTGISFGADDGSAIRARTVAAFDRFVDVGELGDRDAAQALRDLEIDIAVDIMGYTQDARPGIFAHRPAPLQVSYLGYPGTMGADFIDYIIADAIVVPPGEETFYSEQVVRLPDCYQVNDRERPIDETSARRAEAGLPERGFVFCCFNNNYKITAPVFDVWMRLLSNVDGSVLWLLRDNDAAAGNLKREARSRSVDPARLVFANRIEQPQHLARHRLADLFLDTLPYNAHSTCSDALWAGLPVLTCTGKSFAGRVAASLLHAVGLPELVTGSLADYAARALWLAEDQSLLGEIRKRLMENRLNCPLFDTDLSRRHLEAAYKRMWRSLRRGERPRSFTIEPEADPA
jgi:protein O-GlcNAc transferase